MLFFFEAGCATFSVIGFIQVSHSNCYCEKYRSRQKLTCRKTFSHPEVSGRDPLIGRAGFSTLVNCCQSNNASTVLVESGDGFARDLVVQETAFDWFKGMGIEVVFSDDPTQLIQPGPTGVLVRQMLGAVNEFVGSQVISRFANGRAKALSNIAIDPAGPRSSDGNPYLGGPQNLMEKDRLLYQEQK